MTNDTNWVTDQNKKKMISMKEIKPEGTFTVGKPKMVLESELTVKEKERMKADIAAHTIKL